MLSSPTANKQHNFVIVTNIFNTQQKTFNLAAHESLGEIKRHARPQNDPQGQSQIKAQEEGPWRCCKEELNFYLAASLFADLASFACCRAKSGGGSCRWDDDDNGDGDGEVDDWDDDRPLTYDDDDDGGRGGGSGRRDDDDNGDGDGEDEAAERRRQRGRGRGR